MKQLTIYVLAVGCLLLFQQCKKDTTPIEVQCSGDCADTIEFNTQILPFVTNYCSGCHQPGGSGPMTINDYTTVSQHASNMLMRMRGENGPLMPQGGPALPDSLIEYFCCWIKQGKPNN